jgi:DNA mismatch endonuclease (patch repair protein)
MPDRDLKEVRSRVMSRIRSEQTGVEMALRKYLWRKGWRGYRINFKDLPGKPDIAYIPKKVAIFVDGCFWHKCPRCYAEPKTNKDYWIPKIQRNIDRDQQQNIILENMGWTVVRIWEHEIEEDIDACAEKVVKILKDPPQCKK